MLEEFCITDTAALKAFADPVRVSILRALIKPRTAKEIAQIIGRDVTTLYYHLRLLEKSALIDIIETKLVSGIPENTYQRAARRYLIDDRLISGDASEEIESVLGFLFDGTKSEVRRSLREGLIHLDSDDSILDRFVMRLTPDEYQRFMHRLRQLEDEMHAASVAHENDETGTEQYAFTSAFYRYSGDDQ